MGQMKNLDIKLTNMYDAVVLNTCENLETYIDFTIDMCKYIDANELMEHTLLSHINDLYYLHAHIQLEYSH